MKELSRGVRFLLGFVTFLLCVVLFVSTLAGIILSSFVQVLSSQENLENLLRQVLFVDMQRPESARSSADSNALAVRKSASADVPLNDAKASGSLVEWIYNELVADFGDDVQTSLDDVNDFVERSTLDDFLVEKIAIMLNDAYTGESTVTLTAEEIRAKIEENAPLIEEVFNVEIDPQVIADITAVIEDSEFITRIEKEGIVNILLNPNGGNSDSAQNPGSTDAQQVVDTVRTVLAVKTLLGIAGLCLVLIALILLVNFVQIWVGMRKIGITLMLASLPAVVLTIVIWAVPAGWGSTFGLINIFEVLLRQIITHNSVVCIGVFCAGLALLIGSFFTKFALNRRQINKMLTNAVSNQLLQEEPDVAAPVEEAPVEEAPVEEAPVEETPVEEIPAAEETEETV